MGNFYKDKNVLVTGGTGFIGTNLIIRLLNMGSNITSTKYNKDPQINDDRITWLKGDLRDNDFCAKACKNQDYVFMCAANTSGAAIMEYTPLEHVTPNVIMNALMLEASYRAKVKKFLFVSSGIVYPLSDSLNYLILH